MNRASASFIVVAIVISLVVGFMIGFFSRDIEQGARLEIVEYSMDKNYGERIFNVTLTNLGDEVGNSTIHCKVLASIVTSIGGVNKRIYHWFNTSRDIRLAPAQTVTLEIRLDISPQNIELPTFIYSRDSQGKEYYNRQIASFEYFCFLN